MDTDNPPSPWVPGIRDLAFLDPVGVPSSRSITGGARIRRWIGARRTRRISRRSPRWRARPRNPMTRGGPEFVDNRRRRSPPDRASAVSRGQAGGNAARFPDLAHRPAVAHKLTAPPLLQKALIPNSIPGTIKTVNREPALAYSPRKPVQTPGTGAVHASKRFHTLAHLGQEPACMKAFRICLQFIALPRRSCVDGAATAIRPDARSSPARWHRAREARWPSRSPASHGRCRAAGLFQFAGSRRNAPSSAAPRRSGSWSGT